MPRYFFLDLLERDQGPVEANIALSSFPFALLYAVGDVLPFGRLEIFAHVPLLELIFILSLAV
jgi:hypothetical protein